MLVSSCHHGLSSSYALPPYAMVGRCVHLGNVEILVEKVSFNGRYKTYKKEKCLLMKMFAYAQQHYSNNAVG